MIYPTITEYIEAIRFSEDNFDKLTNLVPVLKDNGEPYYSSGNFAVVFKMKDKESGKLHAVKCFLKDQEGREESYRKISNYLETIENRYLIKTKFLEKELFVDTKSTDQTEFPVVVMDWVEGVPLDVYIREKINDKMYLEYLCYTFSLMAQNLIEQEFAHGDLKPDNILVKEDGMLVLVDYDGMYVPEMFGERSRELGSPDFQHPDRKLIDFDKHLDDFSLASILLSLKLISIDSSLLDKFGDKDRLLFSREDYREFPGTTQLINTIFSLCGKDKELEKVLGLFLIAHSTKQLQGLNCILLEEKKLEFAEDFRKGSFEWVKIKAERGDADSQFLLGCRYDQGKSVVKDLTKAVYWYTKSAEQGNVNAQCNLGVCYINAKDFTKAVKWFTKSAEQGVSIAQFNLGLCYTNGYGVSQDLTKAVEWFTKSAEQGYAKAQCELGGCYYDGKGVAQDLSKAVEWYTKSANQGNADAQFKLGCCYANGNGVVKDLDKALEWYTNSAEHGNAEAQCHLGGYYDWVDPNKAIEWYAKSAEQGNAKAQCILGTYYGSGKGVKKDLKKAVELLTKSAEQGYASAQCSLGFCYENGNGVAKDLTKAVVWYTKSSEQGYGYAQFNLGVCYERGNGVEKDLDTAVWWYTKSAEQGNEKAKDRLDELFNEYGVDNLDDLWFEINDL